MLKEYVVHTCSLMSKIFTLYHNGEPVYTKRLYEDDVPSYIKKLEEDGYVEIGIMKKETLQKCKDTLKEAGIVDTNSKEYIETQAYNKFEERILTRLIDKIATLKELFKGNMYVVQSIKTMDSVIDDIKDIRKELVKELTEKKED